LYGVVSYVIVLYFIHMYGMQCNAVPYCTVSSGLA